MRVFAIVSILFLLALAVFLVARFGSSFHSPANADHGKVARQEHRTPPKAPGVSHERAKTNAAAGPQDGFYIGKGDQRVYINYATRDPVLRSLIQSVMDGSSDPNAKGRELYLRICGACHQRDGEGKEGVAPPLAGSEWALAPGGGRMVRIVLNGMTGPVRVQGKDWNLPMPPWRENLGDEEVAVVLTYIRSELGGNHARPITPESVAAARKEAHATPETSDELLRISDQ